MCAAVLLCAAPALAADPQSVTLEVPGMYCSLCQVSVRKVLQRVPGVLEAKADSNAKRADVKYDPAQVSPPALAAALTNAGFAATVKQPR